MPDKATLPPDDEQSKATMLFLFHFCKQAHSYLIAAEETGHRLLESRGIFHGRGNIRPIQCNEAINTLKEMKTQIGFYCRLLSDDISRLPLAFTILRYQSLSPVHHANERILQLIRLLEDFRVDCMTPSPHSHQQRKRISILFDQLHSLLASLPCMFADISIESQKVTCELISLSNETRGRST